MKKSQPAVHSGIHSAVQKVIREARRQFFAHGFRSVSMDDLAAELGMSKKTLYAHFPGKATLVEAVLKNKFAEVERDLGRLSSGHGADVEVTLRRLLGCVQEHTAEIQPAFVRDIGREAPGLFQFVEQRRRRLIRRHFGALFKEGQRSGIIRTDIPVHLLVEVLLGAVQSIMNPPKLSELGLTLETGYSSVIRVILEGAMSHRSKALK